MAPRKLSLTALIAPYAMLHLAADIKVPAKELNVLLKVKVGTWACATAFAIFTNAY
jgi:hypothetical protein